MGQEWGNRDGGFLARPLRYGYGDTGTRSFGIGTTFGVFWDGVVIPYLLFIGFCPILLSFRSGFYI